MAWLRFVQRLAAWLLGVNFNLWFLGRGYVIIVSSENLSNGAFFPFCAENSLEKEIDRPSLSMLISSLRLLGLSLLSVYHRQAVNIFESLFPFILVVELNLIPLDMHLILGCILKLKL